MIHEGRARVFGDDVNSDYIISSKRKRETIDGARLREFLFEAIDPAFAASVQPGDIIVAGRNFGCGSAMEVAVTVIQAAGIHAVVARSFARSFFRNAMNNGLVAVECDTARIREGDRLEVALLSSDVRVRVPMLGIDVSAAPIPELMRRILASGGLVPYLRNGGEFSAGL